MAPAVSTRGLCVAGTTEAIDKLLAEVPTESTLKAAVNTLKSTDMPRLLDMLCKEVPPADTLVGLHRNTLKADD